MPPAGMASEMDGTTLPPVSRMAAMSGRVSSAVMLPDSAMVGRAVGLVPERRHLVQRVPWAATEAVPSASVQYGAQALNGMSGSGGGGSSRSTTAAPMPQPATTATPAASGTPTAATLPRSVGAGDAQRRRRSSLEQRADAGVPSPSGCRPRSARRTCGSRRPRRCARRWGSPRWRRSPWPARPASRRRRGTARGAACRW